MASPIRITLAYGNSRRIANPRSPDRRAANGSRTNASSNSASCARQAATISAVSLTCVIAPSLDGIRLIMHQRMVPEDWATQKVAERAGYIRPDGQGFANWLAFKPQRLRLYSVRVLSLSSVKSAALAKAVYRTCLA